MRKHIIFISLLLLIISLSTLLGYSLANLLPHNQTFIYPQDWYCTHDTYLYYNLKTHTLSINIKNMPNGTFIAETSNKTFSMAPTIGANTKIVIQPVDPEEINVGDIIAFIKNNIHVTHRVIAKGYDDQGLYFITKGDANRYSDGKIRPSQIEGVIIAILY